MYDIKYQISNICIIMHHHHHHQHHHHHRHHHHRRRRRHHHHHHISIMFIISVFLFYEYVINHYHLAIHNSFSLRTQKRANLDSGGFALLRFGLRFPLLRLNKAMRKIELPSGTQTCQMENGLSIDDCS